MWWNLEESIVDASLRKIQSFEKHARTVHEENVRRKRRSTGNPDLLVAQRPATWQLDPGFNPFLVRARSGSISHSLTRKLRQSTYAPQRPAKFIIPKGPHDTRTLSTFQIADEVISNRLLRSLMRKNHARFSARAYAYRADLTPHDAISYISSELRLEERVFVAEYDFSAYFDNISHDHLRESFVSLGITMTPLERLLIDSFLSTPEPYANLGAKSAPVEPRRKGLPQGTSVSLFLANVAATPLDRALERLGVGFVRYADDTLIWSRSYDQICRAVEALHVAAQAIGSPINLEKSNGVRLLVPEGANSKKIEMASTTSIDYLGHTVGLRSVSMKQASIRRIKKRVQSLIFSNLLREPYEGTLSTRRLSHVDRDYVAFIWQLRRYLYGPLSENQVRSFQAGTIPPMSFEGAMSFFPLVDDDRTLLELDIWISTQTWLALKKRASLVNRFPAPTPWGLSRSDLIGFQTTSKRTGDTIDLRIPSVRRISSVIRAAVEVYGVGIVASGAPLYLYD